VFRRKKHPMSDTPVQPADFDAYIAQLQAKAQADEAELSDALHAHEDVHLSAHASDEERYEAAEAEVRRLHRVIAEADHSPATRLASEAWLEAHPA